MDLSWTTVVWSMNAAACLVIGLVHLFVGIKAQRAHLLFSVAAISVAAIAACELLMMHAQTPERFGAVLRVTHIPVCTLAVSIVLFVRLYFRVGRLWLAYSVCGLRILALFLNFYSDYNLNYLAIAGLRRIPIWGGETISVAIGVPNPWTRVGELSSVLLLAFIVDASATLWRCATSSERQRILVINGSFGLFLVLAASHAALVNAGVLHSPYLISLAFLPIVLAMSYELCKEVIRAAQLALQLREREVELRRSEQRMDQAAAAAEVGMWEWNVPHDDIWATDRCRSLFGFAPTVRLDLNTFMNALHRDDRDEMRRALQWSLKDGGNFEREYRVVLPDGKIRWITTRGGVDHDADGKPVLMRGTSLDSTWRKDTELELARQRNELAHLSRVTMLGEMSGSLAHELSQPLTGILSNAQAAQRFLARDDVDLDELRAILRDIVADDKRAGEIIHGLRQLLKKGEVQRQPVDLNDQVRAVIRIVRSDLLNGSITLSTDLAPQLPEVKGDAVQLQQILINLLLNGCDAMANTAIGERQLIVRTAQDDESCAVRVTVVDNGWGISPENLERVFEPFYTTKAQGLGLGLAVCRTIISAQGGHLWATNNATRGSSFHFTMPLVAKPRSPDAHAR